MSDFDFDALDIEQSHAYTPIKPVLKGEFAISNYSVPYYQANLTLQEVHRHLKLVEEIPNEHRQQWSIEELFQRDIDWNRVETDIVTNYLKRKEKRSFFNALTVALLPLSNDGTLSNSYEQSSKGNPPVEPPFDGKNNFKVEQVGGIQIANRVGTSTSYIRWDENSIFAATIDGQHRLAALKRYFESSQGLSKKQLETKVPVIFLVLDEKIGFDIGESDFKGSASLLSIVREIFIDLNKHAKLVSSARQVLLDDLELESICTRMLLSGKTMLEEPLKLPLGLVNWKDDTVKFDTGIYLTSINVLYMIVKELLSIKYPDDPLDEDDVSKFVGSVESSLFLTEFIKSGLGCRKERYEKKPKLLDFCLSKIYENEEPVKILPVEYSIAAQDSFKNTYIPLIHGVFRRFSCYKEFYELSRVNGGIDGELAYYHSLNDKGRKYLKDAQWSADNFEEFVKQPSERLQQFKNNKWPFMVVWQKAVLKSTCYAFFQCAAVFGKKLEHAEFLDKWIAFLDYCDKQGLFLLDAPLVQGKVTEGNLWEGISQNPLTKTIKYSNASAKKISDLLIIYWYLHCSGQDSADNFIKYAMDNSSRFPGATKFISSIISALKPVAIQRKNLDEPELIDNYCKTRLMLILKRFNS